jgi:hypothetical protein
VEELFRIANAWSCDKSTTLLLLPAPPPPEEEEEQEFIFLSNPKQLLRNEEKEWLRAV